MAVLENRSLGKVLTIAILVPLLLATQAVAQQADNTARRTHVAGAVTITTKGISLIPAFSLGKPAGIVDVAITDGALSFEPQFRFGLNGKPWSFIFWGRYRPLRGGKLRLGVGAHPSVLFRTITDSTSGVPRETIVVTRYLAGEVNPSYSLAKNLSVGVYYLYSHGVDQEAVQNTHFLSARANLTNVPISGQVFLQFAPQLYYLNMDGRDGWYGNAAVTLGSRTLPLAVSAMVNKTIRTRITVGEDLLWNVSLIYFLR